LSLSQNNTGIKNTIKLGFMYDDLFDNVSNLSAKLLNGNRVLRSWWFYFFSKAMAIDCASNAPITIDGCDLLHLKVKHELHLSLTVRYSALLVNFY
jgi:hypothetical protein